MRYLYVHPSFPGPFYEVARRLAADSSNQVVFLCQSVNLKNITGITCVTFRVQYPKIDGLHDFVAEFHNAVLQGQAVYQASAQLKKQGFYPDIIIGHSNLGCTFYLKDLFPQAKLINSCESFFHVHNSEIDFPPGFVVTSELAHLTETANASLLLELASCDAAVLPTIWQKQQFPAEYHSKMAVIHDGIDTEQCCPKLNSRFTLPQIKFDTAEMPEFITYVASGKDLYREFPQLMEMLAILLAKRSQCHAVIVGGDQVTYGLRRDLFANYKKMALQRYNLDWSRVHFIDSLPRDQYFTVLQASKVHVYFTYPFMLSRSLLEALSCGCLVLAANTAPVREVIRDGFNGFLAEFYSSQEFAAKAEIMLNNQEKLMIVRERARQSILEGYDIDKVFSAYQQFYQEVYQNGSF